MVYSILTESRIKASVADLQPAERAYSTFWTQNGNLEGWTTILDLDIVGVWNGFLFGTKRSSTTGEIGPTDNFTPIDAQFNERIFFRLKYDKHPKNPNPTNLGKIRFTTVSDPIFNDEKSVTFEVFPDGKWHFYEINMGDVSTWVGNINNIRFFPCINGARNDEFFLNFFEIGSNRFTFSLENEKAGRPGRATGAKSLNGAITVQQNVNDKLIVNIDGYGDVRITLTPQTAPPEIIARDISLQLGKVGIGGYIRAEAFINPEDSTLTIESGIRASDSSVVVKHGPQSIGTDLGFFDVLGTSIYTTVPGLDPDSSYQPLSAYRPTTLEILSLFDNDLDLPSFSINPQAYVVEAGRRDFGTTNRRLTTEIVIEGRGTDFQGQKIQTSGAFEAQAKTLIDINHSFTDDGRVDRIFMNGIANTDGSSKWKIFRPKLDGTLTLIAEGSIGETPALGAEEVITVEPGPYVEDVFSQNVKVRRGDLLGVFNVDLHTGSFGSTKNDAMYYELAGDITGTITPGAPAGAGEAGLPLYARGSVTKNKAVVDIDLQKRLNLDTIRVHGFEDTRDLEYNVAIASSATFSADVPGDHTICHNPTPFIRVCFDRPNAAFNIQALNDDVLLAENGVAGFGDPGPGGLGGADASGATYFYINGDGEFLGTEEFVDQGPARFEFTRDPYGIDCFFSSTTQRLDKPIGKAVIYFKDKKNQRSWQIETALSEGAKGGNGSKAGFQLVPAITAVEIDNKRITAPRGFISTKTDSNAQDILLRNPVLLDTVAADGTRNPQKGVDFQFSASELGGVNTREQATFHEFQWNRFQWEFDAIRTIGFRYFSDFHWSTKISEFQIFAVSESQESLGDNTQILFSSDGEAFTTAALLNAGTNTAEYKLGGSPQYMRLIFRPTLQLTINDIQVNFEEDQVCFGEEGRLLGNLTIEDARRGTIGEATPLKITNSTGEEADLLLDIPVDINSVKQLLYFSKLNSTEDITTPDVGPPGRVDFVSDKILLEEDNIAQNARCYGLVNLVSGTGSDFQTDNLLVNGDFETGTLQGWDLNVIQSGTGITNSNTFFGVPSVRNIVDPPDESEAAVFQAGDFVFGAEIDSRIPEHGVTTSDNFEDIEFELSQTIDLTQYADQIDLGTAIANLQFRYITFFVGTGPILRYITSPTISGVEAPPGTIIPGYGTNLLRTITLAQSTSITNPASPTADLTQTSQVRLPTNTRYLRIEISADMEDGVANIPNNLKLTRFWTDDWELFLELSTSTKSKWYKSWRTGMASSVEFDGWTDSHFLSIPESEFVTTTGSSHWYQPFQSNNTSGVPGDGTGGVKVQTQGFSNAFIQSSRSLGVQSFSRMFSSDPGLLGIQWQDEKEFAGFHIAMHHNSSSNPFFADAWPIMFHVQVLKTQAELGEPPDLNNPAHFRVVDVWREIDPREAPTTLRGSISSSDAPWSIVSTFILSEGPISTEGFKVVITRNCDRFERSQYSDSTTFSNITGCPPDNLIVGFDWVSVRGVGVSYLVPFESVNAPDLPADNVREFQKPDGLLGSDSANTDPIYVAVDLGRRHAIDTSTELFELIAATPSQSEWNLGSVLFSSDNTDDPNQVVWAGSASNARWVRFTDTGISQFEEEGLFEDPGSVSSTVVSVDTIPQATIGQARIYPDITKTLFPTEGYNSEWVDLGTSLSDNRTSTFITGNDFSVIALDLGQRYLIANDTDVLRKRHDAVGPSPESTLGSIDEAFWIGDSEDFWTYASTSSIGSDRPEAIPFRSFGAGVPDFPVRWAAIKIADRLQFTPSTGDPPKTYRFNTPGLTLFYLTVRPRNPEVFTENAQWFSNTKSALKDVSSFKFSLGSPISVQDGVDYGSAAGIIGNSSPTTANNLGDPFRAFDDKFDELGADFDGWGIQVRDIETGQTNPADDFPHSIWRVFRNVQTDTVETKSIKAIKVRGYNEQFYPTTFTFQILRLNSDGSIRDPNLNSSWRDIEDASFTNINTFQEGFGFTHIFAEPVEAKGIRVRITNSVYPDDSVLTDIDPDSGTFQSTNPQVSGPQTRVSEIVMYEEVLEESTLQGTIETNHMLSATVSSLTASPDRGIENINDGTLNSYWRSTGFSDIITISLPSEKPISRLEWQINLNLASQSALASTNAPRNFTLKGTVNGIEQTLFVGSGIENVATFSGTLIGAPVSAKDFTFEITDVQGRQEDANSIIISELRLIEVVERTTPLTVVESTLQRRPGSTNDAATKITYAANSDAVAKITADGLGGGNDPLWSQRDFFSLWMFINDISLLDTVFGNIKLGNSNETHYRWDFKNLNLQSGWNELKLQFRTADNISPIPFQPGFQYNENTGESQVDFLTEDVVITSSIDGTFSQRIVEAPGIRFFELEFRGTGGSNDLEIVLEDFRFVRNKFEDTCQFLPSLYLNNSETFTIFLEGLDIATGTVEFWFQPDWDTSGRLAANRSIIPAIFRIIRPDGKFLSLFYRPNQGFIPMVHDGKNLLQFVTTISQYRFERFDTFHVALVWDARGNVDGPEGQNATLALYINGEAVFGTAESWDSVREGGASVVFGGEVGQRFAATPDNSTALLFTAVPTQPAKNTASSWALLENLKIYNYPKSDFSDRFDKNLTRTQLINPSSMIEIAVSGTGPFVGAGSSELPLIIRDVPSGESATVYVRTNIPKNLTGDENRDASLLVRWKTPLRDCN